MPIEDIGHIGGITKEGDILFLDTREELKQFIEKFENKFAKIIRVSQDCNMTNISNQTVLSAYGKDEKYGYWQLQRLKPKKSNATKTVLYYGDSDIDLYLHKNMEVFKDLDISLVWGEYFYVKYEDDYAKYFKNIYESDEFEELLNDGVKVITASIQIASELKVAGYCVLLIDKGEFDSCQRQMIDELQIEMINIKDKEKISIFIDSEDKCKYISLNNKNIFE